jgi:RNA polymerase sigma-70 factor (ECF subfamily)
VWARYEEPDGGAAYRAALRECEETLDDGDRETIRRRYRDGLSRGQMAAALGLSEDGVKSLLRRVRDKLRLCIEGKLRHA